MDSKQFTQYGKEMVEYIAHYVESVHKRSVTPDVKPNYMRSLLPDSAPSEGEKFEEIMKDIEPIIMKGVTHWHHPHFFGYFPTPNTYPSILGDMLSDAIGGVGFSWLANPACTELEVIMMDWLAKVLDLPELFLSTSGTGGGIIYGSACEATLFALLTAKKRTKKHLADNNTRVYTDDMIVYCSAQAHSGVERAAMFGDVTLNQVACDIEQSMRGDTLREAIMKDKSNGKYPFMVVATLGTTASLAFDCLEEIGSICEEFQLWLHVDAAYAGAALCCPEFRHLAKGLQYADSFDFNPHKWLLVTFDCSAMWFRNVSQVVDTFRVEPVFLQHKYEGLPDYRHLQIPLGRRFRSLKIWFVLRTYGVSGLQAHIRRHVQLAKTFDALISACPAYELVSKTVLGLVCFRIKGANSRTEKLYEKVCMDGRIFLTPANLGTPDVYFLRLAIGSEQCEETDVHYALSVINELSRGL